MTKNVKTMGIANYLHTRMYG